MLRLITIAAVLLFTPILARSGEVLDRFAVGSAVGGMKAMLSGRFRGWR